MTVRIKELREQPLLSPPPERLMPQWARLTQEDRNLIEKKRWTSETDDVKAMFIAYAHSIGVEVNVEPAIESTLRRNLGYYRKKNILRELVRTQTLLKALGLKSRPSREDREKSVEALDTHRIWGGYDIAAIHHDLKTLDIAAPVSAGEIGRASCRERVLPGV